MNIIPGGHDFQSLYGQPALNQRIVIANPSHLATRFSYSFDDLFQTRGLGDNL